MTDEIKKQCLLILVHFCKSFVKNESQGHVARVKVKFKVKVIPEVTTCSRVERRTVCTPWSVLVFFWYYSPATIPVVLDTVPSGFSERERCMKKKVNARQHCFRYAVLFINASMHNSSK